MKHFVGIFDNAQLLRSEDKAAIDAAKKKTGLKYIVSKVVKKKGQTLLEVYLVDDHTYFTMEGF